MIPFLLYQLKAGFCVALFTAGYFIWLRKETFHKFNRSYLVASLILSFLIPVIRLQVFAADTMMIRPAFIESVIISSQQTSAAGSQSTGLSGINYITVSYWALSIIVATLFLWQLLRMTLQIFRHGLLRNGNFRLVLLPEGSAPFSFLNYIFISTDLYGSEDSEQVLRHEFAHARQYHSLDIILLRTVRILQWFNPFLILMEKALKETHEYLADDAVLEQDGRSDRYRLLLLTQVFGLRPGIFNFFNSSLIKNRIMMMTKEKSPPLRKAKYLAVIPMIGLLVFVFSCTEKNTDTGGPLFIVSEQEMSSETVNKEDSLVEEIYAWLLQKREEAGDTLEPVSKKEVEELIAGLVRQKQTQTVQSNESVFVFVEESATFQGGDLDKFRDWVQENLVYPPEAIEANIFGRVTVQFAVNSQGDVTDVVILRGVEKSLDDEVIRVVRSSPKWVAAKEGDRNVAQQFTIPVIFTLTQ